MANLWRCYQHPALGVRQYTPFGLSLSALHLDYSDTPSRLRQNIEF